MDVLRLAVLAFIAAGIVLAMAGVSAVKSVIIAGGTTAVVMVIAIFRITRAPTRDEKEETPRGPTIK
jgi:hypothetical protein